MQTLQELAECFQLYAVCEPCQRVVQVDLEVVIAQEGPDYPLDRLRMRLQCTACARRSQALRIVFVGEGGKASGFRYARSAPAQ